MGRGPAQAPSGGCCKDRLWGRGWEPDYWSKGNCPTPCCQAACAHISMDLPPVGVCACGRVHVPAWGPGSTSTCLSPALERGWTGLVSSRVASLTPLLPAGDDHHKPEARDHVLHHCSRLHYERRWRSQQTQGGSDQGSRYETPSSNGSSAPTVSPQSYCARVGRGRTGQGELQGKGVALFRGASGAQPGPTPSQPHHSLP